MAISQGLTTSFKQQLLQGQQDLATNNIWIALYTGASTIGPDTTAYSVNNEVVGTNYSPGGKQLTGVTIGTSADGTIYINFDNVQWPNAAFTARGALIYNVTQANSSIAVLDFGADKTCSNQTFTVAMPANTVSTALLRFI